MIFNNNFTYRLGGCANGTPRNAIASRVTFPWIHPCVVSTNTHSTLTHKEQNMTAKTISLKLACMALQTRGLDRYGGFWKCTLS